MIFPETIPRPARFLPRVLRRAALTLVGLGCLTTLQGCLPPPAAVSGATPLGPSVTAGGRMVRLTPPQGFCVDPDSIKPGGAAAFALIEDCALAASLRAPPGGAAPREALVDGLVTLSIGDTRLFAKGLNDEGFNELERYLRSDRGRTTAGMGGDPETIRILQTRRAGDTLYVLVEDKGEQVVPVLGVRFWRAFTEVNERAVIASLGVFDTDSMRDGLKLAYLARVVTALKQGNGAIPEADELQVAAAAPLAAPLAAPRPGGAPPGRPQTSREASGVVSAAAAQREAPAAIPGLAVVAEAESTGDEAAGDAEGAPQAETAAEIAVGEIDENAAQASLNAASAARIGAVAAQVTAAGSVPSPIAGTGSGSASGAEAGQGPALRPDGGTRLAPASVPRLQQRPARRS